MSERYELAPVGSSVMGKIMVPQTFRWMPYKKGSEQLRKGTKGRWQRTTEYGWENCEPPQIYLKPVNGEAAQLTAAVAAEREACRPLLDDARATILELLEDATSDACTRACEVIERIDARGTE